MCLHPRASGGTIAAIVRVKSPSGRLRCFEAETVAINGPFASATGRWRDDSGTRRAYVWPAQQLVEIRYLHETAA